MNSYLGVIIFLTIFSAFILVSHLYSIYRIGSFFGLQFHWYYVFIALVYSLILFVIRFTGEYFLITQFRYITQFTFYVIGFIALVLPLLFIYDVFLGIVALGKLMNISFFFLVSHFLILHTYKIGVFIVVVSSVGFFYAIYQFEKPISVQKIELSSDKITRPYHFIHISDLQFGSVGRFHIKRTARLIEKLKAEYPIDFIINTGDHIDTRNYKKEELSPLVFLDTQTFFSLGNHEFYHGTVRILNILKKYGYIILREKNELFQELNIIGIDDSNNPQQVATTLKNEPSLINKDKYNILLYHRPVGILDAKTAGVDLMLSGHTHGGQYFPYTLITSSLYNFPQGLTEIKDEQGDFALYLTDGIGLWGPKMRIGTRNEIALITISPSHN